MLHESPQATSAMMQDQPERLVDIQQISQVQTSTKAQQRAEQQPFGYLLTVDNT